MKEQLIRIQQKLAQAKAAEIGTSATLMRLSLGNF